MTEKELQNNQNGIEQPKIPFGIITQYIKDQSFENPDPVESFLETRDAQPTISVDIAANAKKIREGLFEISLDLRAKGFIDEKKFYLLLS